MESANLMTGDWVIYPINIPKNPKVRITEIRKDGIKVCVKNETFSAEGVDVECLQPILLTPEILEKNGFNKDNGGEECWGCKIGWLTPHEYDDSFEVKSWETEILGEPNSFSGVINYVHQLQHALKLCEFDKEIVL